MPSTTSFGIGRAKRFVVLGLAAVGVLLLASPASATTIFRDDHGLHVDAGLGEANWYNASYLDPGSSASCPSSAAHGCFWVYDYNPNPVTAGSRCVPNGNGAVCADPGGRVPLRFNTGDQDDIVGITSLSNPRPNLLPQILALGSGDDAAATGRGDAVVRGGSGDDSGPGLGIYAGQGNDQIRGGPGIDFEHGQGGRDVLGSASDAGADSFFGEQGRDRIKARDGEADTAIKCGPGDDFGATIDVGLDPSPQSC
jgi:hypothetical protein